MREFLRMQPKSFKNWLVFGLFGKLEFLSISTKKHKFQKKA